MRYKIILLRHGKTLGNEAGRYIGCKTDENLSEKGIEELKIKKEKGILQEDWLNGDIPVFVSPMKRCRQTASLIFFKDKLYEIEELKEIDFGLFENKNYKELNGNTVYQEWIDSGGKKDYPDGERLCDFMGRTLNGWRKVIDEMKRQKKNSAVIVCHGGNIMAILSSLTKQDYFDFQVGNGEGFYLEFAMEGEQIVDLSYNRI